MSSIPTRRTTRTTRAATLNNENANARPSRSAATRAKPPSKDVSAPATRATGTTAASRAKVLAAKPAPSAASGSGDSKLDPGAAGKRKREALGEVTVANGKNKAGTAASGKAKGKEVEKPVEKKVFDGVVLRARTTTTTTTTTIAPAAAPASAAQRAPMRVFGMPSTRRTRSAATHEKESALEEVREEVEIEVRKPERVMEVDAPAARRASARKPPSAAAARPSARSTRRHPAPAPEPEEDEEEEDDLRASKKRRTSSEIGDEERRQVEDALALAGEEEHTVAPGEELVLGEVEADPNGTDWDDLDAEDADDPQMVSEYVVEIFEYLKEVEQTTMPNPGYMDLQKELAWKMRGILSDWLIQVHFRFRLLPETLFLAVNIIDRFLSARVVSLAKLQLVGIACMFVAAKVEEIVAPSASNFLYCADSSYSESEILQAERYILKTLEWNLSYPNPMHFLRRISKADEYNVQVRTIGKYLMEISCLEWRLIAAPPSLLAGASIWLARLVLNREDWTPNLAHYSSYRESELVPTANLMLNYVLKPVAHQSFYKKYASKKYLKASTFVREWALERWEEGTRVNLQEELPELKALIRASNERERALLEAGLVAGDEGYEEAV